MEKGFEKSVAQNDVDILSFVKTSTDPMVLDNDGDAMVSINDGSTDKNIQFLVSTKALSLASLVFAKMFGPNFEEGRLLREEGLSHVTFGEDDVTAMEVILRALYYQNAKQVGPVNAKGLASLAIYCDKYNCRNALSPWVSCWFSNLQKATPPFEDLGFLLLAAYKFDEPKHFADTSK